MHIAAKVLGAQCAAAVVTATLFWVLKSSQAALAATAGALAAIGPTAYLAWRMNKALRMQQDPRALVGEVYRGEMGKFALTLVAFAAVFALFPTQFLPVLSAYVVCTAMYVIGPLVLNSE